MKKVVLLGSTGSIGTSACKVAGDLPDRIQLIGLAAGNNVELLAEQARQFKPAVVSVTDPVKAAELRSHLGEGVEVLSGDAGLLQLATLPEADIVL
ncbi:MAG TPA: 1-deoxy-D-xylulose-5-phosphate reductoisomerase, partial [Verrucomicrobiae bacterium]|nr:1-deoxy-D-xylulose-5-phosphate reductoisomerase [Verrucomicrobiae bacterium]